jgi:hypothetical protein
MPIRQRKRSVPTAATPPTLTDAVADRSQPPLPEATLQRERVVYRSREDLIAEAAYRRAEARGFAPGGELKDWLAAEKEIDALLAAQPESQKTVM